MNGIRRALQFTQVFDPLKSTTTLAIGVSEHAGYVLLPRLIAAMRTKAPAITLRLQGYTARDSAISMLDTGEIDVAIGVPPADNARILTRELFQERFVCIVRKDHPVSSRRLTLKDFLALSHLLVSPENDLFGVVDAELAKSGLKRRLELALPQMYVAPLIVAQSDLIATLMAGVVESSGLVQQLAILEPPIALSPITFVMAWHRRNDAHPVQQWFRDFIAEHRPPNT